MGVMPPLLYLPNVKPKPDEEEAEDARRLISGRVGLVVNSSFSSWMDAESSDRKDVGRKGVEDGNGGDDDDGGIILLDSPELIINVCPVDKETVGFTELVACGNKEVE